MYVGGSYLQVRFEKEKVEKADLNILEVDKKNVKAGSVIKNFSKQAKRNMMYTLSKVRRDAPVSFVTLTYPKVYSNNSADWKNDLKRFGARLHRKFSDFSAIWKVEPQRRGAPHYHMLIWGVPHEELVENVPYIWNKCLSADMQHLAWHRGELGNEHCVKRVDSQIGLMKYVTKYINKSVAENWGNIGKWWGMLYVSRIPFAELCVFEVRERDAYDIMRYMRRYTGFGHGMNLNSRQQICDAAQWMEKLQTKSMLSFSEWENSLGNYKDAL